MTDIRSYADVPTIDWQRIFDKTRQRLMKNNCLDTTQAVPKYELLRTAVGEGHDKDTVELALNSGVQNGIIYCTQNLVCLTETWQDEITKESATSTEDVNKQLSTPPLSEVITDQLVYRWCCEYFHDQLDRPIDDDELPDDAEYTTPRGYYRQERGWSDGTIDAKQLGYAPPEGQAQFSRELRERGATVPQLIATGFFKRSQKQPDNDSRLPEQIQLEPIWKGRFVLPYSDPNNEQLFAISRRIGDGHSMDYAGRSSRSKTPAKYHKLPVSYDQVRAEEPIYGLDTIEDGKPLLITEGIADAITAHQAGYPCISPVTTQFKRSDYEQLHEELTARGIDRVYLIQDAERPRCDKTDGQLTTPQMGSGRKGALNTACYLTDCGIDARIADLPLPGLDKVDLDDYLQRWDGDLQPVLASAKPRKEQPETPTSDRDGPTDSGPGGAGATTPTGQADPQPTDGDTSAVYDLSIEDVTGCAEGYRGKNPLGHHGNSTDYFRVYDEQAYDHKYKATYTPLTYLLCQANKRPHSRPEGDLSDEEIFVAWKHAKKKGLITSDDPIPSRALRYVALDAGIASADDLEDGWKLPQAEYHTTLQYIENEYDVAPGRQAGTNRSSVAIPFQRLQLLSDDEKRRYAEQHGIEWPTTSDARDRLTEMLHDAIREGTQTVLDAPTALGKSYTAATTPWTDLEDVTENTPVVQLHATREARDQAYANSQQADVDTIRLQGRSEACPVAAGKYDPDNSEESSTHGSATTDSTGETSTSDTTDDNEPTITMDGRPASQWFEAVCEGRGIPFSHAHSYLEENNDQGADLPCCAEDEAECPAIAQWNGVPRTDDGDPAADVVHATHMFGHVPSLRYGTNLIIDEQPDYTVDLSQDRIRRAVTAFLQEAGAPVRTFEGLVSKLQQDETIKNEHARHEYISDALKHEPNPEWYFTTQDAHTLAPALTNAIWNAFQTDDDEAPTSDRNGLYHGATVHNPPRLDAEAHDDAGWNRAFVSIVLDDQNTVRLIRQTPDFSQARSVVGLDAHPCEVLWQQNIHPEIRTKSVLSGEARRLWRYFERGLTVVQVGDGTHPLTNGRYFNRRKTEAFFSAVREQYTDRFRTAITAASVESETKELLKSVGVESPETMHYGEEKSRGDFGNEDIGVLNGCIDPGDDYVLELLAEAEYDAAPAMVETDDGETKRERGRTFTGPDADVANALLASVREQHVAQAAGRYARNAENPDDQAIVFVRTDAIPPELVDAQVPGVESVPTDLHLEIVSKLRAQTKATAAEIADAVECSKEHVRTTLQDLSEDGLVQVTEGAGANGAHLYEMVAESDAVKSVGVSLSVPPQTTNDHVYNSSTESLAVSNVSSPPMKQHGKETLGESMPTAQQSLYEYVSEDSTG